MASLHRSVPVGPVNVPDVRMLVSVPWRGSELVSDVAEPAIGT